MRSLWSGAGEACVTAAVLIGLPLLASGLGWPLGEEASWTWLWQYLRGGTLPADVVLAVLVVLLWAVWAAYLAVVVLDIIAVLRGLVPRVGAVRLVWVLVTGGTTAASTHTAAVAAHTDTVAQAPAQPEPEAAGEPAPEQHDQQEEVVERTRVLANFGFDSADFTPAMRDSLEPTLGMIDDLGLADTPVVVTGHADPVGDPTYNEGLSERRAQAVADHLADHLEEDVVVEVGGMGSAQPPTDPDASYAEHRRVEIAYTLQPPNSGEEPGTEAEAEPEGEAAEQAPEQVQLDVSATGDQSRLSPLLLGAVAATAGVGAGYAVGRGHAYSRRERSHGTPHEADTDQPEEGPVESDRDTAAPSGAELVHRDPLGLENGVIDNKARLLVTTTLRIDGSAGLAFTGTHAADAVAAAVTDHLPAPVVATRGAAEVLQKRRAYVGDLMIVPDLEQARIAVQARALEEARTRMEDDLHDSDESRQAPTAPVLVVCEARELESAPVSEPGAVVCVLGEREPLPAVHCTDLERPHVIGEHGRTELHEPLRHRPPDTHRYDEAEKGEGTREGTPSSQEPETEAKPSLPPSAHEDSPAAETAPGAETAAVRVRLFGPEAEPELTFDGHHVQGLRSVARTLVAYLALHPRGTEAEQIDAECFGDADPSKAYAQRRNAIHSLRHTLRKITGCPDAPVVIKDKSGLYRLDRELFDVDLWNFLRQSKALRKNPESISDEQLLDIIGIHKEKLLGGCAEPWAETVRQYCAKEAVSACVRLAERRESATEKIQLLETALAFDEYNEPLYRRIIGVYRDNHSPERAYQAYRALKDRLNEIGEKPTRETRRMVEERSSSAA